MEQSDEEFLQELHEKAATQPASSGDEDPTVAAVRASQLLFQVLKLCSERLGFASLNPTPLRLDKEIPKGKSSSSGGGGGGGKGLKSVSIPQIFAKYASRECASFLNLFDLERAAATARHKLMKLSMKVRFREKLLENKLEEKQLQVWERRVRAQQRERYRQISGRLLNTRSRLVGLRSRLRGKEVDVFKTERDMVRINDEIKSIYEAFAATSKVEFKLEVQLMRLIICTRETEKEKQAEIEARQQREAEIGSMFLSPQQSAAGLQQQKSFTSFNHQTSASTSLSPSPSHSHHSPSTAAAAATSTTAGTGGDSLLRVEQVGRHNLLGSSPFSKSPVIQNQNHLPHPNQQQQQQNHDFKIGLRRR